MRKDRIIELLEDQNKNLSEQITSAGKREEQSQLLIRELTVQVRQLNETIRSLEEALTLKDGKLKKQENISRGLGKLISNESEKQIVEKPEVTPEMASPRPSFKERGNNKSKRKEHFEVEEQIIEVNPDPPPFSACLLPNLWDTVIPSAMSTFHRNLSNTSTDRIFIVLTERLSAVVPLPLLF